MQKHQMAGVEPERSGNRSAADVTDKEAGGMNRMAAGQARGMDTKALLPVYGAIFMILNLLCLPWFSMPVMKYGRLPATYTIWKIGVCVSNLNGSTDTNPKLHMHPLGTEALARIGRFESVFQTAGVVLILLLALSIAAAFVWKKRSAGALRVIFLLAALYALAAFGGSIAGNLLLNAYMHRESTFINLTIHSYLQLSPYVYAQLLMAVLLVVSVGRLMDTRSDGTAGYANRIAKPDRRLSKRTVLSILIILVAIPFVIFFGIFFLNDRSEIFIALCIITLSMIPFAMVFEQRRPQAREILLIAVMAAIAVVGRMAFFMIPQFKPVTAIVIITGISLGAEAGFATGAVAGFVSNFFFGQGPWTPWQMFAFGIIGFLAGLIFRGRRARLKDNLPLLCIFGGVATFVIYGFLLDTASVTMFATDFKWETFLAMYASGVPFNIIHGVSTIVFLFFMARPFGRKLDRVKKKYGILEA